MTDQDLNFPPRNHNLHLTLSQFTLEMAQKTMPTQSVWSELCQAGISTLSTLQPTRLITSQIPLCTSHCDRRQSSTMPSSQRFSSPPSPSYTTCSASGSNEKLSTTKPPPKHPVLQLQNLSSNSPHQTFKCFTSVTPKAAFYVTFFLIIQSATSYLLTHLSYILASASLKNRNLRRRCSRLHARGLQYSTAAYYHDLLNVTVALALLVLIRGLELHIKRRRSGHSTTNCSPGFLRFQNTHRSLMHTLLAVPMAVVYVYTCAARQRPWSCLRLLLV